MNSLEGLDVEVWRTTTFLVFRLAKRNACIFSRHLVRRFVIRCLDFSLAVLFESFVIGRRVFRVAVSFLAGMKKSRVSVVMRNCSGCFMFATRYIICCSTVCVSSVLGTVFFLEHGDFLLLVDLLAGVVIHWESNQNARKCFCEKRKVCFYVWSVSKEKPELRATARVNMQRRQVERCRIRGKAIRVLVSSTGGSNHRHRS